MWKTVIYSFSRIAVKQGAHRYHQDYMTRCSHRNNFQHGLRLCVLGLICVLQWYLFAFRDSFNSVTVSKYTEMYFKAPKMWSLSLFCFPVLFCLTSQAITYVLGVQLVEIDRKWVRDNSAEDGRKSENGPCVNVDDITIVTCTQK